MGRSSRTCKVCVCLCVFGASSAEILSILATLNPKPHHNVHRI